MTNAKKELTGFKCHFSLEQRLEYHRDCKPFSSSYLGVLQAIASEFNGTLENIERKRYYGTSLSVLVRTSSKASNTLLDLYFSQFPLFTCGCIVCRSRGNVDDCQEWSKVLALIIKGRHQTKEGLQTSLEAKESMNSYRSSWNWKHLSTFYTLQKPPHPLGLDSCMDMLSLYGNIRLRKLHSMRENPLTSRATRVFNDGLFLRFAIFPFIIFEFQIFILSQKVSGQCQSIHNPTRPS